jgi:hypothetical protein
MLGPLIAVRRYRIGRVTNRFAVCWTPRHRSHVNTLRRKRFPLAPSCILHSNPVSVQLHACSGGTTRGCSRVTDSAEPPPHFISHFCKTVFQQCFVSVNSSSSRTPLPAPRLNERQPQRVIQTQNQLHRDNTHGARGLHWQTLPPPPQPAAALCRQRRRHLAPCFGTPAACIGRCSIIVPWYFHLLERSAAFTRTRAAPCESDSSTPSTTTTETEGVAV